MDYAAAGLYVFPCVAGAKSPAISGGWAAATNDPGRVAELWDAYPNANIGCSPHLSGHCVIDIDPPIGEANLSQLEGEHEPLPESSRIDTPRGGTHYWFEGALPSSVGRLGTNIDTRGIGGYVLLPPSSTPDGQYTGELSSFAPLPGWIRSVMAIREHTKAEAASDVVDLPANIDRAAAHLRGLVSAGDVAVMGFGSNARSYQLACELMDLGLSADTACDLMLEHWNPHCVPPWPADKLRETVVEHATKYRQNDIGAHAVPPLSETYSTLLTDTPLVEEKRLAFDIRGEWQRDDITPPAWLVPEVIAEKSTAMLTGQWGSAKSFVAVDMGLSLAAGVEFFGEKLQQTPVLYAAHEGRINILTKRSLAWKNSRDIWEDVPFYVSRAPLFAMPGNMDAFIAEVKASGIKPGLVILDTLAKCMVGMDENSAKDAGIAVAAFDRLAAELDCAVLGLHHEGKDGSRGSRGSSALPAGFDTVLRAEMDRETKAFKLSVVKQKDADEREDPWYAQLTPVGGSAVLVPIDASAYRQMTNVAELGSKKDIAAILRRLGQPVSTHILAGELVPQDQGTDDETRQASVVSLARMLDRRAKNPNDLMPYAIMGQWQIAA